MLFNFVNNFQDATYYFYDAAPQWEPFNGDNWLIIENRARSFAEDNQFDAVIYTGTNGLCQLLDVDGNYVDIYLYAEDGAQQLPVPKFYWKVIVDTEKDAGVALIGVNNPHITEDEIDDYKICSPLKDHPIMEGIPEPDNISKGVIYACEVGDAADVIEEIPSELANLDLLT